MSPKCRPSARRYASWPAGDERPGDLGVEEVGVGGDEGRLVPELRGVQPRSVRGVEFLPGAESSAAAVPAGLERRDAVTGHPFELARRDVTLGQRLPGPVRTFPDDAGPQLPPEGQPPSSYSQSFMPRRFISSTRSSRMARYSSDRYSG